MGKTFFSILALGKNHSGRRQKKSEILPQELCKGVHFAGNLFTLFFIDGLPSKQCIVFLMEALNKLF